MGSINKGDKIKVTSIMFIILVWLISYLNTPLYGLLNGMYFASILTGIYLFRDKYFIALILSINSQLLIIATFLLNGDTIEKSIAKVGFELPILIVALSIYLIINAIYKDKHKENKKATMRKMSNSTRVIVVSLIVITTMQMLRGNTELVPLLYTVIIPLVIVITMIMHIKEYYTSIIIYSLIGLYVCYMQINIGQLPYLHVITNITILVATVYEIRKISNK